MGLFDKLFGKQHNSQTCAPVASTTMDNRGASAPQSPANSAVIDMSKSAQSLNKVLIDMSKDRKVNMNNHIARVALAMVLFRM